ncbi:MAG: DUF1622 domain-containing protein [Beijerinckiaceae bacterium]
MPEGDIFDAPIVLAIKAIGTGIEAFGVLTIVSGIAYSTFLFATTSAPRYDYDAYKIRIGRSLLLGLELLVAADIIRTVALELTFTSLGLLAGLVLVRTFLSWTLVLEIEGRWPWQPKSQDAGASRSRSN